MFILIFSVLLCYFTIGNQWFLFAMENYANYFLADLHNTYASAKNKTQSVDGCALFPCTCHLQKYPDSGQAKDNSAPYSRKMSSHLSYVFHTL